MRYNSSNNSTDIEKVIMQYSNILFRMCFILLKNEQDAQDVLQETFIKYMEKAPAFENENHEKAWLIKVSSNLCKDLFRFRKRNNYVDIEELKKCCPESEKIEILKLVMQLPEKYKAVIHLYYIEGYKTEEIAKIIGTSAGTVRKRMQRGRHMLKIQLEEDMS